MKINEIAIYRPKISLAEPFITSLRKVDYLEPIIVKVTTTNEIIGWGEAPTSPQALGETPGTVLQTLETISGHLLGTDPRRLERLTELNKEIISFNTAAKASLDIAIHDIIGKYYGEPVWRFLGGYRNRQLETDFTVSLDEPKIMAQSARNLVNEGFTALKVKIGSELSRDLERIERIREAVGNNIDIRLDINQGWSRAEASSALPLLSSYNIQFLEQPLDSEDLRGMAELKRNSKIPLMADESVHSPSDAIKVINSGAADYINVKLSKSGGFFKADKIIKVAEVASIPCMVGGMWATDLLATAATHLAAAYKNVQFFDLDMGVLMNNKVIKRGGSKLSGNKRAVPQSPGLGIEEINYEILGESVASYNCKV